MPARCRLQKNELIWLAGNTFYGVRQIFSPDFLAWLAEFRLPDYELRVVDGQFELSFQGRGARRRMWEIPALAIINELRSRAVMRPMSRFELDVLYARAKAKAVAQGRAAERAARRGAASRSPISARAAATASCGSAGAWRR